MFNNPLRIAIREKLDTGLTHQQVYDELTVEGEDNRALVRMLKRMPSKAAFEATKIFRNIILCFALAHILFGVYFINNIMKPSLSQISSLWIQFGLFAVALLIVSGYYLQRNVLPNFIMLIIPIAYFSFLNKIIPPQFTTLEILNVILFLLLFVMEILYTYKLKRGIDIKS